MNFLIIEDEYHAVKRLQKLIRELKPKAKILCALESVEDSVEWFKTNKAPDLVFLDIQLADGLSFEIFNKVKVENPVIFTTAFNEYAIRAFKVNSVDYLLKPIDKQELKTAFEKFDRLYLDHPSKKFDAHTIQKLLSNFTKPKSIHRFLIKRGHHLSYIPTSEVAYFYSENAITYLVSMNKKKHNLEYTLEDLDEMLDSEHFFRINRKFIVKIDAVQRVTSYFNHRLKLELSPKSNTEAIVSRDRVKNFKAWLGT